MIFLNLFGNPSRKIKNGAVSRAVLSVSPEKLRA